MGALGPPRLASSQEELLPYHTILSVNDNIYMHMDIIHSQSLNSHWLDIRSGRAKIPPVPFPRLWPSKRVHIHTEEKMSITIIIRYEMGANTSML
eukprot:4946138-Pleurochrysis_carterae.AAC.1